MTQYTLIQPVTVMVLTEANVKQVAEMLNGQPTGRVLPEAPMDPVELGIVYDNGHGDHFWPYGTVFVAVASGGWVAMDDSDFVALFTEVTE